MLIELINSIRYALLKKQSFWIAMLYGDILPDLSGKTELAATDVPTGTIAFLSDQNLPPPFNAEIKVYLIDADGKNQQRLTENRYNDIDSAWFDPGFAVTPTGKKATMWGWLKQVYR